MARRARDVEYHVLREGIGCIFKSEAEDVARREADYYAAKYGETIGVDRVRWGSPIVRERVYDAAPHA